jgi:hypothetical protein
MFLYGRAKYNLTFDSACPKVAVYFGVLAQGRFSSASLLASLTYNLLDQVQHVG